MGVLRGWKVFAQSHAVVSRQAPGSGLLPRGREERRGPGGSAPGCPDGGQSHHFNIISRLSPRWPQEPPLPSLGLFCDNNLSIVCCLIQLFRPKYLLLCAKLCAEHWGHSGPRQTDPALLALTDVHTAKSRLQPQGNEGTDGGHRGPVRHTQVT